MERVARFNWALEERDWSLSVEAQVWRDLVLYNDAATNALRAELQHTLSVRLRCRGARHGGGNGWLRREAG
jgi:hypothetical protein